MASPAQIEANRLNSLKSTGPRSHEGKAASSMNALKHGALAHSLIIPGEDPEALAGLAESYRQKYQPVGPEEEFLLDTIVQADWTRRRMARLEAEVFKAIAGEAGDPETALGPAFQKDAAGANALQKIYRRQQAANRQWYQARKELSALQDSRFLRDLHTAQRARTAALRAPIPPAAPYPAAPHPAAPAPGPRPPSPVLPPAPAHPVVVGGNL